MILLAALAASSSALAAPIPAPAPPQPGPLAVPAPPDAEPADDDDAELDALREQLERMQAESEAARKRLEALEKEIASQRRGLADVRLKQASGKDLKFELSGYYRARANVWGTGNTDDGHVVHGGLYADQPTSATLFTQRLRLGIKFSWKDVASLNLGIQGLDDVVWGDNADLQRTALFAYWPSNTNTDGNDVPSFELFRAWTEFKIPVGLFRVGRQSSHWGLGILANDGDGFRNDFGEAHYQATFDRILFATNPVKIAQTITKKQEKNEVPLIFAVAYDKLVSDPASNYYGYKCSPNKSQGQPGFDARCDVDGDGITDADHDYQGQPSDTPTQRGRKPSWWANQRDDVQEMVYALMYKGENLKYFKKDENGERKQAGSFNFTAGTYVIHRWQRETKSQAAVIDGYVDASVKGFVAQAEAVAILGHTKAITLPDSANPDDPLAKKAKMTAYVARLGYEHPQFKFIAESGYASGDSNVNDGLFTGRSLDPDYNVGLILYEEVLRTVTNALWNGDAKGLRSRGGVYNSHYVNPRLYIYPYNNTQLIAGFLLAMPDKPDGAVILCDEADAKKYGCLAAPGSNYSSILGYEVDLALKHTFHERINASFETAWAHATNRIPLDVVGLNPKGNFWTFQARVAWLF
jgi:hypothetical protein